MMRVMLEDGAMCYFTGMSEGDHLDGGYLWHGKRPIRERPVLYPAQLLRSKFPRTDQPGPRFRPASDTLSPQISRTSAP
jgi:hypothetical protein